MKKVLSIAYMMLPLLALSSAHRLSAQTLVVDKTTLTFSGQVGGSGPTPSQTVNVTSSTGAALPFTLSYPSSPWLKVNGQLFGFVGTTPAALTITADPTGLAIGTYNATISIQGGTNNPSIAVTFSVGTIGVSPQSLTFSYTLNSNNFPVPQNISLNSTVATQCTATAATTGGNWVGPLQNPCVSPGNVTVQLNSSVITGLAAGTYNGTITITPSTGGGPAAVVPITLTVLPTPPVTVNPQSLVLNYQTGIAAPNPSQTFTITTTANQQLGFSFIQSGSLTNISTISPASGSTSASTGTAVITYTVNPATLAVGTYTGKITLFTFGGSPPQQDIAVTLNVSNTALLNVPSNTLNFSYQSGTNAPAAQTVAITATSGALSYSVTQTANSPWLVVPNAGTTATPLSVSVNPTGLTPGTYSATINVLSATPGSTPQQIPVVLKVTNDPLLGATVNSLAFPYQIGQLTPATQSFQITSSTGAPLNYTATLATTTCGSSWLLAANANNTLSGVTNDTLNVAVATAGLTAGTCNGTITINATNPATGVAAVNSPITIPVTLFVSTTAQLVLTPPHPMAFTSTVGAPFPTPQNITLSSTNTDVLNYTTTFQTNSGNWLFAGPQSGSTAVNNILTLSVIPTGLQAGTYTGTVTITATGPGGAAVADSPVTLLVTLNVTGATNGSLTLSATDVTFPDQVLGGPAPSPQTVTIGSTGQALNYTAVANSNTSVTWLSVSPASGNTSSNGVLTLTVDGSKLTAGSYNGSVVVTSTGAGNSPATINVHFKVDPGTISAPTTTLTFTQVAGGAAPAAQTIAVTGSPSPLNFTTAVTMQTGSNWLSATPASGTTPANVQVSVNGSALSVGQYTGTVTITSTGASGSPIAVPVVLNVVSPATIAATPTTLTFAYAIGQQAPPAQNVQVTGSTSVPFTTQLQFDGTASQWMTVSPASGNTPATLAVSVTPTGFAAGTYTGRIVISSPNSSASVTIPVTLTVSAIPNPVISAVANAGNYSSTGGVSPGENIVIFGTGIGPATLANGVVTNNAFTTNVGNTRVLFDGVAAPIIYASAGQTSVMVPYGVFGRTTTSVVVEYSGVQSTALTYNVVLASPGIYTQNSQGTGPGSILNQNGSINGPNAPEKRGNVITVYMTGEGMTTPQGTDGTIIPSDGSGLKKPLLTVTATIGGVSANVLYAGSAPGIVSGVMQVNLLIPANAPTGAVPVVVNVGTATSASFGSPTVAIQ
jgi:uncharacterized protein (TIGR03437 family)